MEYSRAALGYTALIHMVERDATQSGTRRTVIGDPINQMVIPWIRGVKLFHAVYKGGPPRPKTGSKMGMGKKSDNLHIFSSTSALVEPPSLSVL
jgi:hypothetical protein